MNQFCCKLAHTVHRASGGNGQLWGSVGQRSKSQDGKIGQTCEHNNYKRNEQILLQIGKYQCSTVQRDETNFGGQQVKD